MEKPYFRSLINGVARNHEDHLSLLRLSAMLLANIGIKLRDKGEFLLTYDLLFI